jgi:hypothetical protein
MRHSLFTFAIVAALVPAAALAATPAASKNASSDCTALKARMGASAFAQAYSTFGACVSRYAQLEQQNGGSANAICQTLQANPQFAGDHGGKTFAQYYGTGKNGKNAFGNCVSATAKAASQAEQQARSNPAQTCRSVRTSLGVQAFDQKYGTKPTNYKNAFGRCVAQAAHAQAQSEFRASSACSTEQNADVQAFMQKYGSNTDRTNAFGKCVASKK